MVRASFRFRKFASYGFITSFFVLVAIGVWFGRYQVKIAAKPQVLAAAAGVPDKSKQYNMPVLVLRYFPTADGINLDSTITGVSSSLTDVRAYVDTLKSGTLNALEEASRLHGYKDAAAPVSMHYSFIDDKEYLAAMPVSTNAVPWYPAGTNIYRPDYMKILTDLNICNYVDTQGIKEVWVFGYHWGNIEPTESNMAGPYGDISNSEGIADMPVCSKTYVLYNYNYGRGTDAAVHDHGHQLEAVYNNIDSTTYTGKFEGPWRTYYNNDGSGAGNAHRCGWTHDPPNTPATPDMIWGSYDYSNTRFVWTDCEDWNPGGTGQTVNINCDEWKCDEVKFHIWQWQNMPGLNNPNPELSNWWDFIADFDAAKAAGEKLYYPPPTPTPTPLPTLDTDKDGFTDYVENYMGTDINLACGPNAWPPDFNNDGISDSADMSLISAHYGSRTGGATYDKRFDLNADGFISASDLTLEGSYSGKTCTTPRQSSVNKEIGPDGNNSTQNVDVCGADLGSMFDWNGKVYNVFGDTFGCPLSATPVNWRSNTLSYTTDSNPSDGITFDGWIVGADGKAKALIPHDAGPATETAIPTYGVSIGTTGYLFYFEGTISPSWSCNYSSVAKSTDGGQNWTKLSGLKWSPGNFNQVAIYKKGGYVYFFGIPCGRTGGAKLMRVLEGSIENKAAYEYVTGFDPSGNPTWTVNAESSAVIVVPAPVGELSVRWDNYLGKYIMMYLKDVSPYTIQLRSAPDLWGPWGAPQDIVNGNTYPCLYAPYMREGYEENDGQVVYFRMSRFCTGFNPYSTYWMKVTLQKDPTLATPTPMPTPTPSPTVVPIAGDPSNLTATTSCNGASPKITFSFLDNSNFESGFWLDISKDPFNGPSNTSANPSVWGVKGIYRSAADMTGLGGTVQFTWDNETPSLTVGPADSGDTDSSIGADQKTPQSGVTYFWRVKAFNFGQGSNHIYPGGLTPPGTSIKAATCP